ncbi:MAG: VWA domain-containing protein [Phycisphaerales bacterium]|nr:VWA domain-containing protein [Phycisphaerales bacterium]
MSLTPPIILAVSASVLVACLLAEWWHGRRVARVARLAFGPTGRRAWVVAVPFVRAIGAAAACWGLLTLLSIDGTPVDLQYKKIPDRHLVIALDVSPSMYVQDAGPEGRKTRQHRAADVLQSILTRLDMRQTRVTVVAFYSSARPVVLDTTDLNVVNNILYDLPLAQAFKEGKTNMYEGIKAAAKVAEPWRPGSATLVVVSDGDSLPPSGRPELPPSIGDALVIGIGNPYRASNVGDSLSRQDAASLKQLAAQIRGVYHDGNATHLPTSTLRSLTMMNLREDRATRLRTIALVAVGGGAAAIAAVSPLLGAFGLRKARPGKASQQSPGRSERAISQGAIA